MRERSKFVLQFQEDYGRYPEPSEVTLFFLSEKETVGITQAVTDINGAKFSTYNFGNIESIDLGMEVIPTLEFRQHEGTLDGGEVAAWIQTLAGVVSYVEKLGMKELVPLLRADRERGKRFTIIDLLGRMGPKESAEYYKCRLFHHPKI
jgi:hypothetical protein